MVSVNSIREIIREIVGDEIESNIGDQTDFNEAGIDSLDHANILFRLAEIHKVNIKDEDLEKARTISNLVELAKER